MRLPGPAGPAADPGLAGRHRQTSARSSAAPLALAGRAV